MNYIGRLIPKSVKEFYYEINSATLTGAIDVIVIEQPDGSFLCSPFHVRFGKLGVLRSKEKIVDIEINGEPVDIHMKLGDTGEAFFIEEIDNDEDESLPSHLATSPFPGAISSAEFLATELEKLKISQDAEEKAEAEAAAGGAATTTAALEADNEKLLGDKSEAPQIIANIGTGNCSPLIVGNENTNESLQMPNFSCETRNEKHEEFDNSEASPLTDSNYNLVAETVPKESANHEPTTEVTSVEQSEPSQDFSRRRMVSIGVQTSHLDNTDIEMYNSSLHPDEQQPQQQQLPQKRRKRRKHSHKRNFASRSKDNLNDVGVQNTGFNFNSSSLDPSMDDIFQMDDDWEEDSVTLVSDSLTRSSSVPTPSFYSNKLSTPKSPFSIADFHPYSDGEVTPRCTTPERRPSSPKSDTEYEMTRRDATSQTDPDEVSWPWGELPQVSQRSIASSRKNSPGTMLPPTSSDLGITKVDNGSEANGPQKKSVLGGVLNFIKNKDEQNSSNKKLVKEEKGIFLDDLNPDSIDPEVAELYFPKLRSQGPLRKSAKDDDTESGNGPSLPQSPQCNSGPQSIDSDSDQERPMYGDDRKYFKDVEVKMSLCGGVKQADAHQPEKFQECIVSYEDFSKNATNILQNPELVVQIENKYYSWRAAAPIIVSLMVFQRPVPDVTQLDNSLDGSQEKKKKTESRGSWWSWRRSHTVANSENLSLNDMKQSGVNNLQKSGVQSTTSDLITDASQSLSESVGLKDVTDNAVTRSVSIPTAEIPQKLQDSGYVASKSDDKAMSDVDIADDEIMELTSKAHKGRSGAYKKTLRLSSDQIRRLSLKEGANEAVFSVTTAYQGTSRCMCHIYLWRHDDKIIISDIDGTITKSDVFGHILPMLGVDWAQSGVANLFTKISENGYKLLYLSARAIGQARTTREYLKSVRQGELCLPDGPLFLSPTSLISAFHREVIEKKPEEFKIACLRDIQTLFPSNPFYAGFGNKINDTWAYRAVGIPASRIFTINHRGELKLELIQYFQSTYTSLTDVVDHMFPSVPKNVTKGTDFLSEYSPYMYWREPITSIDCDDPLLKTLESQTSKSATAPEASLQQSKKPVK